MHAATVQARSGDTGRTAVIQVGTSGARQNRRRYSQHGGNGAGRLARKWRCKHSCCAVVHAHYCSSFLLRAPMSCRTHVFDVLRAACGEEWGLRVDGRFHAHHQNATAWCHAEPMRVRNAAQQRLMNRLMPCCYLVLCAALLTCKNPKFVLHRAKETKAACQARSSTDGASARGTSEIMLLRLYPPMLTSA